MVRKSLIGPTVLRFPARTSGAGYDCSDIVGAWGFCHLNRKTSTPTKFLVLGGAIWGGDFF